MAQVDPNIQAILDEHRREITLLGNQYDRQHQREQARDQERIKTKFIQEQKEKITPCDGSTLRSVREWTRSIAAAAHRVPQGQNADDFVIGVMKATATDDLFDELEAHLRQAQNPVTHVQLRDHLDAAFLGPDEANVLKDEVKNIRQGQREELPRFNRRFLKAAEHAYPVPRDAQTEEMLTDRYLGALTTGRIKDCCFNHDPRLVDLATATTVASDEWARQRRRIRIQRDYANEPMEVDSAEPPLRETLSAMAASLRTLQSEVKELRSGRIPQDSKHAKPQAKPGACWYCNAPGHHQRECRKRQRDRSLRPPKNC